MNKASYLPLILSTTAVASFMVNLDTYIINVSIPAIAADFLVSKADVSWVVISYNLMVVALLLICGKLADRIGLKKLFITGFVLFTLSSLMCALSQNIFQLTLARVIQGTGASILYALPQAIIGKFLPVEKRGMGFGLNASAAALGIMLGSPLSGLIIGVSSWHWIFLINIPIGIFVIALILKNKKVFVEQSEPRQNGSFDTKGAILSFTAILGITFWLNRLNTIGVKNIFMVGLIIISVFLFSIFIKHCLNTKNPLVDLTLFKNKYFTYSNVAMFAISAFLAGNNFILPFYLTEIKNLTEFQTGLLFIVYSASYMVFSLTYGKVSSKIASSKVSTIAGFLSVATIIFFIVNLHNTNIFYVISYFVLLGMSFSFFITSNNNFIMMQARKNQEGAVAGLHRMTGRFGMLFGVVIFEFIFTFSGRINFDSYISTYTAGMLICLTAAVLSLKCIPYKK